MRLIDETLQQLARWRIFRQVVFLQIDSFVLEVGDRLPAARSTRLEVDVDFFHGLRMSEAKKERGGLPKVMRACFAAERGSRSAGSFRESEN